MDVDSQKPNSATTSQLQQNNSTVSSSSTVTSLRPPSSPSRSRKLTLPLTPPANAQKASTNTTTIPAGITIIPPSPLSLNPQPRPQTHFIATTPTFSSPTGPSSSSSYPFTSANKDHDTPRASPGPSTQRTRSSTFCPASQSYHHSPHRREGTHPNSRPGPARSHSHYITRKPDPHSQTANIRSNGLPPPLKRLSIDEFTSPYNSDYSYSITTGSDAQTPTQENGHSGIHRRRPSLSGSTTNQTQQPTQSPRLRQASSEQKLRSPVVAPASSSTLGWLTGNRLTLPPTKETHSKSDDEREDEDEEEAESESDRGNRRRQAIWSERDKRTILERDWRMPVNFVQYGEPSSSSASGSGTPSISMTPPETKSGFMPQGLPVYGNANISPPRTTILSSQAPLGSASLQPLPQDPFNILPLSLPSSPYASPVPSRSATPLHSAHPSMADLAAEFAASALPPAPPTSGSGSSPRTSISTSSSRYGWGTGRSDSRSSEEDDVVPPVTTSHRAWWQQRSLLSNQNHNDVPVSPKIQISTGSAPRIIRLPSSSNKFMPTGTRSWGWLFGMIPSTLGSSSSTQSKSESAPRKNSISAKARNRERDRLMGGPGRRRTNQKVLGSKWLARVMVFVPTEPWSISFFLLFLAFLAVSLTFTIKHILNPDKEPLPWREYCTADYPTLYSLQDPTLPPPHVDSHVNSNPAFPSSSDAEVGYNSFAPSSSKALTLMPLTSSHPAWPYHPYEAPPFTPEMSIKELDQALEPVGVLIGVFTTDSGAERRHMIRQTYASHWRSRRDGTEGVRVRFVMGRPRKRYEQAVQLEMEAFNDILLLDIEENMNSGKTHAFFSWAAENATVPDWEYPSQVAPTEQNDSDSDSGEDKAVANERAKPIWKGEKRPSYVVKADDDSFIMLAELEKRLRVAPRNKAFWGYLVKNSFMAGECYALSFDLVKYIGASPALRTLTHGKEDKLVAKWMNMHPEREQIVWLTERCWIYDHPKAGTVYSHGFLFPSTVAQVRSENTTGISASTTALRGGAESAHAYSTVSKFGVTYRPLLNDMSAGERIEALIEGSELSQLRDEILLSQSQTSSSSSASSSSEGHSGQHAFSKMESNREKVNRVFASRPSRAERFLGDPEERGGTVVVHYIKKPEWFVETSIALLGGADDQAVWHRGVGMGLGALERRKGRVAMGMGEGRLQSHVGKVGMAKGDDGL
ncbi:hypothetical protein I316_00848 [Kwoniella heveanensis BCC8398]|uniref:Glycosyltransferase family 31 protein n=1 Tax=Kwoniella heveanensis BCC8398 TaxID=1296120 RepID=A0A1B9H371_9TREE|nr:hypothetical protein I316_00848 [Kwoniella heveanensis BCC8398]